MNESKKARFDAYVKLAKFHKQAWVRTTNRGDMNPTVIGFRDGKPQLLVVAPKLDKWDGLEAANVLRRGFAIDEVVMMVDGHTILTKGKSREECERLYDKYVGKPGSMQKACDEEGACANREIADCLVVHYLDTDKAFHMANYPYDYHGKDGGVEFRWMDDHAKEMLDCRVEFDLAEQIEKKRRDAADTKAEPGGAGPKVGGTVPCTLHRIMSQPTLFERRHAGDGRAGRPRRVFKRGDTGTGPVPHGRRRPAVF